MKANETENIEIWEITEKVVSILKTCKLENIDTSRWDESDWSVVEEDWFDFIKDRADKYASQNKREREAIEREEVRNEFVRSTEIYAKEEAINFSTWYSGMEREKVITAYQRYLKELKSKV